ncbi:hypothetical protein ANCCAN_09436 [Ancylostoma caninum]|uniref:Protein kinase domain-containing protein n=1 Tax=Ancylostoma caninum TaxID=29170 RepID=A0A368GLL0_ANCCA|nr:hypothetical protein ANCCAN_09436 [Ancylostoma caninum]
MLVRDPSKRAGLAEIVSNPWVMAGDRGHAAVGIAINSKASLATFRPYNDYRTDGGGWCWDRGCNTQLSTELYKCL